MESSQWEDLNDLNC